MKSPGGASYWLVGAYNDDTKVDMAPEFLEKGIWTNGYADRYLELVKSMKVGDRLAIKSSYTQKRDLPFDSRGLSVSVMAIKAVGTITENLQDGRHLRVEWSRLDPLKKWYFFTFRGTIWKLTGDDKEYTSDLIDFVFSDVPQDIDKFRNGPYWRERFGDMESTEAKFRWTAFYEEMADALLPFKDNRKELIKIIGRVSKQVEVLSVPMDKYKDGTTGPWKDICPFTFFGMFNKGLTDRNRQLVAQGLADELGVTTAAPDSFPGIPVLNNQSAWFFGYESKRHSDDIDKLWGLFEKAISFADEEIPDSSSFESALDDALTVSGVKWNITMGLYWVRPWSFVPLDRLSRNLVNNELRLPITQNKTGQMASGKEYVALLDRLATNFISTHYPIHSFPELSLRAWNAGGTTPEEDQDENEVDLAPTPVATALSIPFGVVDILKEGSFLPSSELEQMLAILKSKKNLVLQGPPGTGKTWLAKRLANALIGKTPSLGVTAMQFHSNLSYEDFVRGWRPVEGGRLDLVDGPFLEMVDKAIRNPEDKFVFVIEEINRGNPAQVFGEMLTLLEADKRGPSDALQITYRSRPDERIFIPPNLYLIGTMNTADRSLALLDFAFRRRFAFVSLKPTFNSVWEDWLQSEFSIPKSFSRKLGSAVESLNQVIAEDRNLGPSFAIGHSFFTPRIGQSIAEPSHWASQVIQNEVYPTLREYWYDDLRKAEEAVDGLIKAI
jgi:5-methylcytosine-specific restriction protein B